MPRNLIKLWKDFREGRRRNGAVPSPVPTPGMRTATEKLLVITTNKRSPDREDVEDSSGPPVPHSNPPVPHSKPPSIDARATPPTVDAAAEEPHQPVVASNAQQASEASPSHAAETDARPVVIDPGAKEPQRATESEVHQVPTPSEKLWNDAYDLLEGDNAELVDAYLKTLVEVRVTEEFKDLKAKKTANNSAAVADDVSAKRQKKMMAAIFDELGHPKVSKAIDTSAVGAGDVPAELEKLRADISAELRDRTKRREFMKKLVEEGQTNIATASAITEGIGNAAQFILSGIGTVNTVTKYIPQAAPAALPLAGACVGLNILLKPGEAARSNREGIARVVSTMEWYCTLSEHLLDEKNIVVKTGPSQDIQSIRLLLKKMVIELYKAILLYQMKSVCSYYRNQGCVFLRRLLGLDKLDGDLNGVTVAENNVRNGSEQYNNELVKRHLRHILQSAKKREELLGDIHQGLRKFFEQQRMRQTNSENKECLEHLRVIDPLRRADTIAGEEFFPGAYEWILEDEKYAAFTSCDKSNLTPCRLLWIKGDAGTGKTMLLVGIIRELSKQAAASAPTLSCFFCQSTDTAMNNATDTLRSLIWMLVIQQPHLISHLKQDYGYPGIKAFTDGDAWSTLSRVFKNMLKDDDQRVEIDRPVYFIVDALDECDREDQDTNRRKILDFEKLIKLISDSLTLSDKVRWLVSGRPEVNVLARLETLNKKNPDITKTLAELSVQRPKNGVEKYIEHRLDGLKVSDVGPTYTSVILASVEEVIRKRARNNLLWISLVFNDLELKPGDRAVENIQDYLPGLSGLYRQKMDRINKEEPELPQYCGDILMATSLAYRPLFLSELEKLVPWSSKTHPYTIVARCKSFLTVEGINGPVSPVHKSAKDYLVNNQPSLQGRTIRGHTDIVQCSIGAMSTFYDLSRRGFESKDITPLEQDSLAPIRYSCLFWLDHLRDAIKESSDAIKKSSHAIEESSDAIEESSDAIKESSDAIEKNTEKIRLLCDRGFKFLKKHFLHWLESLSVLYGLPHGITSVRVLLKVVKSSSETSSELAEFLKDAERFATSNGSIIEQWPLQTYGAALVFCPSNTKSKMKELFWGQQLPPIETVTGVEEDWDICLQTLEGERGERKSGPIMTVAFSPDDKMLAAVSADGTIQLWNVESGTRRETLKGHNCKVWAVAFLSDGKTLASALDDGTIRLWGVGDAEGHTENTTLEGYSDSATDMAFSPDGETLATSAEITIRLWDVKTGTEKAVLREHTNKVMAVAFSSDSKMLASASEDYTVRLWDAEKGTQREVLRGHLVGRVAFSPERATLALAPSSGVTQLWNPGQHTLKALQGYNFSVAAVAFSPDDKTLGVSYFNTVGLWNAKTGTERAILRGHNDKVRALVFSSDGKMLASASDDGTVRLWDTKTRTQRVQLIGHISGVKAIVFSPNGKMLASASKDQTVQLWDAETSTHEKGTPKATLEGHGDWVAAIAFSPDNKTLASASYDCMVRLWDAEGTHEKGTPKETLPGYGYVTAVAFSRNGEMLASASDTGAVWFWEIKTGTVRPVTKGHNRMVEAVAFSPNNKMLASASDDGSVRLWDIDATTDEHHQILEVHVSLRNLSFSQGCRHLETDRGLLSLFDSPGDLVGVFVKEHWITRHGQNLLWLPRDYRRTCSAISNNVLVLGHASGRVTFLTFDPTKVDEPAFRDDA